MRGLLIANPNATTSTPRAREVLMNALQYQFQLETTITDSRGHAAELAARARAERVDCVIVFGGDGTVNEVVNGMLGDSGPGPDVPALGVVPGGSANVFSRALGFPTDPIEATGELIQSLRERNTRTIGLGQANSRWFVVNAGLGIDAEIIAAMEEQRGEGKSATPTRYVTTSIREFFRGTDRKLSSLVVFVPGQDPVKGVFIAIVQNAAPWTYLGAIPLSPSPNASFDAGLDLWALRSMSVMSGLRNFRRMLARSEKESAKDLFTLHDSNEFTVACRQPTALQLDGEGLGLVESVKFTAHPAALQVLVPCTNTE
ncbi:MAG: diacylglycerol kinase family protein [Actinomycetes bacterium]